MNNNFEQAKKELVKTILIENQIEKKIISIMCEIQERFDNGLPAPQHLENEYLYLENNLTFQLRKRIKAEKELGINTNISFVLN